MEINVATVDNPSNALEWTFAEMLNKPETLQKAKDELDSVVGKDRAVIKATKWCLLSQSCGSLRSVEGGEVLRSDSWKFDDYHDVCKAFAWFQLEHPNKSRNH
ncbi:hypothetical protein V6N12_016712 [Hibiscus sabdariffa]|uniref:Uncharacterized protein n=1 Tax=Hibiscus sabdariffa TaxID=183260 RepID=A0ABR2CEF4_9ROSI